MRRHHLIIFGGENNEYTLKLDGKVVSSDYGDIKEKSPAYLFYAVAFLDSKIYEEGIVVSSNCKKGTNKIGAMLKIICRKYESLTNKQQGLKRICEETKKELKTIEGKIPSF